MYADALLRGRKIAPSDTGDRREIAENLHRAELSKLERSNEIAEWVKLCDDLNSQVAKKPQGGRPEGGVNAASRELGPLVCGFCA